IILEGCSSLTARTFALAQEGDCFLLVERQPRIASRIKPSASAGDRIRASKWWLFNLLLRPIDFRMHRVPLGRLLERQSDTERRGFVIQAAGEHDRARQTRRSGKSARDAHRRMTGEICDDEA